MARAFLCSDPPPEKIDVRSREVFKRSGEAGRTALADHLPYPLLYKGWKLHC